MEIFEYLIGQPTEVLHCLVSVNWRQKAVQHVRQVVSKRCRRRQSANELMASETIVNVPTPTHLVDPAGLKGTAKMCATGKGASSQLIQCATPAVLI